MLHAHLQTTECANRRLANQTTCASLVQVEMEDTACGDTACGDTACQGHSLCRLTLMRPAMPSISCFHSVNMSWLPTTSATMRAPCTGGVAVDGSRYPLQLAQHSLGGAIIAEDKTQSTHSFAIQTCRQGSNHEAGRCQGSGQEGQGG